MHITYQMKNIIFFLSIVLTSKYLFSQEHFEKSWLSGEKNFNSYSNEKAQPQYNSLSDGYDVKFYGIDLEAGNSSVYISGNVTIGATVVASVLDTFVFELHPDYTIDSIRVNGLVEDYLTDYDDVIIPLSPGIPEDERIDVQVFYHGAITKNGWAGIMHSGGYHVTFTLTEPLYAKDWFPCKQVLTDKADSVFVFITTDESLKTGSNGLLTADVPLGGGKVRHEWKTFYPTAFYLISFAVGDYYEYDIYAKPQGINDSILIQNYLYSETALNTYKDEIDLTADLIEIYSELFGMYPFKDEKYGHCMAPIGGGMEHQTMTTLSGFNFELVSHELTHMWFGDFVTCGTWQDIWINEGFATYGPFLALEQLDDEFPTYEMTQYHNDLLLNTTNGSIFIPESRFDIDYTNDLAVDALTDRIFDWYLSYEKGAVILHMLRYELNDDELFFSILRTYLSQYQYGNATGTDFETVVESKSGRNFTDFFNQWYFGEGYPKYNIQWFQAGDTVYFRTEQTTTSSNTSLFRMNMDYGLIHSGNESIVRLYQDKNVQIHKVYFPETVTRITVDPDEWLLVNILSVEKEVFLSVPETQPGTNHSALLYPNPVKDRLNIQSGNLALPAVVTLYDLSGRIILTHAIETQQTALDVSSLSPGMYTVEIISCRERIAQKLIIQ